MKYFILFIKKQKKKTALSLFLLLGQVIGTLLIPSLIAGVVDQGILKGNYDAIVRIGIQMLLVSFSTAAISIWGSYATADLAALFGREMRSLLISKTQELSIQQFDAVGLSSMITRAASDIANLQQTLGIFLQLVVPAPFIVASAVVMTATVSPTVALVLIFFMLLFLILAAIMLKKSNKLSRSIQSGLDKINQVVRESITGVRVIRAFGNENYEADRSGLAYERYADKMIHLNKLFAVLNPAVWLLMGICMAAIVSLGGIFSLNGTMEVGEITAVTEYAVITLSYLVMAAATVSTLPKTFACLDRLTEVLDTDPAIPDHPGQIHETEPDSPAIEFDHVTFAYPGAEEPVIRDLSFQCMRGKTTAIIGSTGSGKSTVADLLIRLHDIQSGSIRLSGLDIQTLSLHSLREKMGCVPQKSFLFSGTIADNLHMGKADATEEEMWQALRISQAEDFVKALPLKLMAPVSQGGTNFSGGQRQRLSIARALIRNTDIFVFDDSFSALDVRTDRALRDALHENLTESAILIIAQRISTIMNADQILVLDEGELAGCGTHKELMKSCTIYQSIAKSQMNREEAN